MILVSKRDGTLVPFDKQKIINAITEDLTALFEAYQHNQEKTQ